MADRRTGTDNLPELVEAFVASEQPGSARGDLHPGAALLDVFETHVRHMSRTYPDAWFTNTRKDDEAILDLAHRTFTSCARIEKGRFPFQGRTPFGCYIDEQFDGRTVRYHSFYAKLSIARELIREDYARNLTRNPVLRWRADLYRQVRDLVRAEAEAVPQGRGLPPRWQVPAQGIRAIRPLDAIEARLRRDGETDVRTIVFTALRSAGPLTASRLTNLAEAVLGTPPEDELELPVQPAPTSTRVGIRRAVVQAWQNLDAQDQMLLAAIARGERYDALVERCPQFRHKVAVSRAVSRCGKSFMARIAGEAGLEDDALPKGLRPQALIELVLEVLAEVIPEALSTPEGGAK